MERPGAQRHTKTQLNDGSFLTYSATTSVINAKQAIAAYKKAVGEPEGLAELMVFYCEQASAFCAEYGNDDEGYYCALTRMFAEAIKVISRLDRVREVSERFGHAVGDEMDELLAEKPRRGWQ